MLLISTCSPVSGVLERYQTHVGQPLLARINCSGHGRQIMAATRDRERLAVIGSEGNQRSQTPPRRREMSLLEILKGRSADWFRLPRVGR